MDATTTGGVTLEALDRRLDAIEQTLTTLLGVLRAVVAGQQIQRETVMLMAENLRGEMQEMFAAASRGGMP